MSRRQIDSRGEKAISVFLDKYFYDKAREKRLLAYFERIYDAKLQIKGIDVLLDKERKIDEKAQLHYINRPLESFAFEIDYYSEEQNRIVDGWFVNVTNETEEYMLLWIDSAKTEKINRIVSEDFECVTANLLNKKHLKEYLIQLGITDQLLKKDAYEMRKKEIERIELSDDIYMRYSLDVYSEKPINMVIKKNLLDKISSKRFKIRKDGIEVIQ